MEKNTIMSFKGGGLFSMTEEVTGSHGVDLKDWFLTTVLKAIYIVWSESHTRRLSPQRD